MIAAAAKLTSVNAPKEVRANMNGKLVRLFAKEDAVVKKGSVLGYIESVADHEEVIALEKSLEQLKDDIDNNAAEKVLEHLNKDYQHLGELQQQYQSFIQSLREFSDFLNNGFYIRKKMMLLTDLDNLKKQYANLLVQKNIQEKDLGLVKETFEANKQLKNDSVISAFDYRNEESKLLNKQLVLPQLTSSVLGNESQQNEKHKEILELENKIAQQKNVFLQALNSFKSQAEEWNKKYILTAPIDGQVAFAGFLQENQQVNNNQVICFINPGNTSYYVEMHIPQTNFAKVKTGQQVLLKFPSYPYQEYGAVSGTIDFISNVITDSGYLARIILPNGLTTNYNKQVQFHEGLAVQGEIITERMRLLQRFFNNTRQLFSR
jgi:HlyD family secretion protein